MPHLAASDLVLHCLPMSHKKDDRLIWVNTLHTVIFYQMFCWSSHGFYFKINVFKKFFQGMQYHQSVKQFGSTTQARHFFVPDLDSNCLHRL